jgi:type IV pilus assembly protein PilV
MDIPDGLVRLENAPGFIATDRPLMGAADASFTSEGNGTFYEVAWRTWRIPSSVLSRNGQVDHLRILVMVRFPTVGTGLRRGIMRQVNTWAVKTDSRIIMDNDPNTPEF